MLDAEAGNGPGMVVRKGDVEAVAKRQVSEAGVCRRFGR
jgi:hypothetical protein